MSSWPRLGMLERKVLRDLWSLRGPAAAIALVVAAGVACFVAMRSMVPHLAEAQHRYYVRARFADVWVSVKRAPRALLPELAALEGIAELEARVTGEVILKVRGLAEPAHGHLIGVRADALPRLNQLVLRRGRWPSPAQTDEVVVSEGFARANQLDPGDSLSAILNGRSETLQVVGIALTPEYVLELKPGDLFPDRRRYGIIWAPESIVDGAFGMRGAWNEVAVRLVPTASREAVIAALDERLAAYGGLGAYGREQQPSHRFLSDEIRQARTFATVVPLIFLGVSAFLVHLVLSRLVTAQREQIGMLKAFGFTPRELARHYTWLAIGPVVPGLAIGIAVGVWLAGRLALLYAAYYRIPDALFSPHPDILLMATGISLATAGTGALGAVRRVLRLPAAEAMRPESPPRYRAGLVEHWPLLQRLPPIGRLTVRGLERRPVRAALAVLGMALSVAVLLVGLHSYDAIAMLRRLQFTEVQREDVAVTFTSPRSTSALRELARLPGVLMVEPSTSVPVRVRAQHRHRRLALVAVPDASVLRRAIDRRSRYVPPPPNGLLLSRALADALHVTVGDAVQVEVLIGRRPVRRYPVARIVDDLVGTGLWLPVRGLIGLTDEDVIDGALVRVSVPDQPEVLRRLQQMPGVAGIASRTTILANFDQMMHESFGVTLATVVGFAFILALGVIYNTTRIALAERGRELASLRVLGFSRAMVAALLFGELLLLGIMAVPVGFAIGIFLCWLMAGSLSSELFRLPLVIEPRTLALSASILLLAAAASSMVVRRQLDRLDLIAVLKTRE